MKFMCPLVVVKDIYAGVVIEPLPNAVIVIMEQPGNTIHIGLIFRVVPGAIE